MRNTASVGLKRVGVHLLEFLARGLQGGVVNIICDAEIFNALPSLATTPRAEVTMTSRKKGVPPAHTVGPDLMCLYSC
jgi:hypothetical protein